MHQSTSWQIILTQPVIEQTMQIYRLNETFQMDSLNADWIRIYAPRNVLDKRFDGAKHILSTKPKVRLYCDDGCKYSCMRSAG